MRNKIRQARRTAFQKEQKARVDVLCSVLAPSDKARASELVFGVRSEGAAKAQDRKVMVGDLAIYVPREWRTVNNTEFEVLYPRAVWSHVCAQAEGVAKFVQTQEGCQLAVEFVFVVVRV